MIHTQLFLCLERPNIKNLTSMVRVGCQYLLGKFQPIFVLFMFIAFLKKDKVNKRSKCHQTKASYSQGHWAQVSLRHEHSMECGNDIGDPTEASSQ